MKILSLSDTNIAAAAAALREGKLVAFPTETVYGLGGDAFNTSALARIFEAKNRPRFDPLIVHIAAREDLERAAAAEKLAGEMRKKLDILCETLWPGPLTLVLPKQPQVPGLATAGLDTVAVRCPGNRAAQTLVRLSTGAVAAPSANRFGCLSPTRAEHVRDQLGEKVDIILDGGRTEVGVESTVLDLSEESPRILRPGGCSRERIEALIGPVEEGAPAAAAPPSGGEQRSPGLLKSHYAPGTPLTLYPFGALAAIPRAPGEGRLYFKPPAGGAPPEGAGNTPLDAVRFLSESGSLTEAAANLFDILHEMDSLGLESIKAEETPPQGLGAAVNDRLRRAASSVFAGAHGGG
jgi:L-threonylcarbamoyladenylate synthase